jgi:glutathione S-transferase
MRIINQGGKMLKIYGANLSSPCIKVRLVANALGLKYEYIKVSIRDGDNQKPEFLKLNPFGKIPAMDDGGFGLFESGAICRYLLAKQKTPLFPDNPQQRAVVDQWADFSAFHVGVNMGKIMYNRVFAHWQKVPVDQNSLNDGIKLLNKFLPTIDAHLGQNAYLAGADITYADLTLLAYLDPAETAQYDFSANKNLTKWRNALKQKPFYTQIHKDYDESFKKTTMAASR